MVCIDDSLAFVGGIDLTVQRWDTSRHAADDPVRLRNDGSIYDPVHDVHMLVDGQVARRIAELAHQRWTLAVGKHVALAPDREALWPPDLAPDFIDTPVAIARTYPAWGAYPPVREAAALTLDALSAARRTIYIESQYMTAPAIGDVLERHLANLHGPEIIVVQTHESHGLAERLVMGANCDRLIRRLRKSDPGNRLRVYYPVVPGRNGGECQVLVHSKLIIVDDVFLRVGSSNLNNRSIGLDTECDLAIESTGDEVRRTITHLRDRLLAEHLASSPATVAETTEREGGSVIRAIDHLNTSKRGLRAFEAMSDHGPTWPALGTKLLDPLQPFEPLWFLRRKA
jgi:phosphatidylserine/phosphatidylglycerophosphate/cardiolipin synthase-like enzyme